MRIVIAKATMLLCGLLAVTALVPAIASAGYGRCDPGEFCLYYSVNRTGGVYNFSGSDRNLYNDRYEGAHTHTVVANTSISVWNRGVADASGKTDVIVYSGLASDSARRCIPRGAWGDLDNLWWQEIDGYEWVTRARCNKVPRMPLRP
jgi:hypothetical protein